MRAEGAFGCHSCAGRATATVDKTIVDKATVDKAMANNLDCGDAIRGEGDEGQRYRGGWFRMARS
jgi:hypothetical protein